MVNRVWLQTKSTRVRIPLNASKGDIVEIYTKVFIPWELLRKKDVSGLISTLNNCEFHVIRKIREHGGVIWHVQYPFNRTHEELNAILEMFLPVAKNVLGTEDKAMAYSSRLGTRW